MLIKIKKKFHILVEMYQFLTNQKQDAIFQIHSVQLAK